MSITTSNWSSETLQHALINFLVQETPRYVPFPGYMGPSCDAIFVNRWFENHLIVPETKTSSTPPERLFEVMRPDFNFTAVLGIKHLMLNRHGQQHKTFRLQWLARDEASSEVFLISCHGISDHVAVIPTPYLRRRFGTNRCIEGALEVDQACPTILAPFMVHHRDIAKFLEQIYLHATNSADFDLMNPTYSAMYYEWRPELHRLGDILPIGAYAEKLNRIQDLYFASKTLKVPLTLSRRGEAGYFTLDGNSVDYLRKAWMRCGRSSIRVTLKHPISNGRSWRFLLLEDHCQREAICLPRHAVPSHLIGLREHRGNRNEKERPQIEVPARVWAPFTFAMISPLHTIKAIASIIKTYGQEADRGWNQAFERHDSGYESSTPRRTSSVSG